MQKTYKFEIDNWNKAEAKDLAQASYKAQTLAMGKEATQGDLDTFTTMATAIDNMLTDLGTEPTSTVYVNAYAQVNDVGNMNLSLNFNITPLNE